MIIVQLSSHTAVQISHWNSVINSLNTLWCSPGPHVLAKSPVFTNTLWCAKKTKQNNPARWKHASFGPEANRTVSHRNCFITIFLCLIHAYPDIFRHFALLFHSHTVISPFLYNLPAPTLIPQEFLETRGEAVKNYKSTWESTNSKKQQQQQQQNCSNQTLRGSVSFFNYYFGNGEDTEWLKQLSRSPYNSLLAGGTIISYHIFKYLFSDYKSNAYSLHKIWKVL